MTACVYILRCADGSYYVGTANDLTRRLAEHQSGYYGGYTSSRLPVELVWSEQFERITDAIASERQIKGRSRAKKEALIGGKWRSCNDSQKGLPNAPLSIRHPEVRAALAASLEG